MKIWVLIIAVIIVVIAVFLVSKNKTSTTIMSPNAPKGTEVATFAGGCFWCVESDFDKIPGVKDVVSGYAGGDEKNPTYEQVSSGKTNHRESAQIFYDPKEISYEELLERFWTTIDPLDSKGQFCDKGFQYTSAIFYHSAAQKKAAENSKKKAEEILGKKVETKIIKFTTFYDAEDYHQDYYEKNPIRYNFYRFSCGRDSRTKELWDGKNFSLADSESFNDYAKPSNEELKKLLTPLQYQVTQESGTEKPFENEYWNNTEEGIYVDVVSGEPLFSSKDKFESGTGWPSFTKPLVSENIVEKKDFKLIIPRTEIRSKNADSHVGHLFKDGPEPTGLRYCMNSAALRFIPKKDLKKEGYEEYLDLFE